ncbi:hypothetical protein DFH08DRAFT_92868 [Mycena albidolilacea]|uniref:Uncharacterized protein n=1 Tax=Mycena albidolilacea TaxID=1033008 RepID=A0AAD7A9M2_9AGAR|nr:hypothetical protein DFH08DRAFT_92868 [Mycena albidolilacea]
MFDCHLLARRTPASTAARAASTMIRSNGKMALQPSLASSATNAQNIDWSIAILSRLQELGSSVPAGPDPIIPNLSTVAKLIQQTPANVQGLEELAVLLAAITKMAQNNTDKGHPFFKNLNWELQSLAGNLEAAWSQGRLNDFFNTAHNNSSYMALVQLIADSALVTADEFIKSIREAERQKLHCSSLYGAPIVLGDVTGGFGGTGGTARIGGEGGEADGPQLDMDLDERYRIGNISGGIGGTGGIGIEVGGKGGAGKGPVICMPRWSRLGPKAEGGISIL